MGDNTGYFVIVGGVVEASGTSRSPLSGTRRRTFRACTSGGFDQFMSKQVRQSVARKADTIPITCSFDNHAHHVTDDSRMAGQRTGCYQALCGHLVSAAALATPLGRPCADCIAVSVMQQQTPTVCPARGSRHRQPGWLRRILSRPRSASMGPG